MTDPLRRQQRSRSADGRAARRWVLVGNAVRRVPNRFPMAMGSDWQIVGHSSAIRQTSPHTVPNKLFQPFPGVSQGYHSCPVFRNLPKSRVAHNPKVAGSNPAPATKSFNHLRDLAARELCAQCFRRREIHPESTLVPANSARNRKRCRAPRQSLVECH